DVHALGDALRMIDAMGCDAIVCAGDTVDYGLFPNETLALLAEEIADDLRSALEQVESVMRDLQQRAAVARGG
ncbi:MAG: hypothetical protein ACLP1X_24375, partial [Polyangiaceae bacterium]